MGFQVTLFATDNGMATNLKMFAPPTPEDFTAILGAELAALAVVLEPGEIPIEESLEMQLVFESPPAPSQLTEIATAMTVVYEGMFWCMFAML